MSHPYARVAAPMGMLLMAVGCAPSCEPVSQSQVRQLSTDLGGLQVEVNADPATVQVARADGTTLLNLDVTSVAFRNADATYDMQFGMFNIQQYPSEDWQHVSRLANLAVRGGDVVFDVLGAAGNTLGAATLTAQGPSHLTLSIVAATGQANRARMALDCAPADHFNGLGAQTHDVDHRGQHVPLWVSEQGVGKSDTDVLPALWQLAGRRHTTHIPIPGVVTSRGTAWVVDTYAYAELDFCAEQADQVGIEVWDGALVLQLYDGPGPLEALARMSAHLGRPSLPAPWMLAPWNDAIFGSQSVLEFAQFLKDNHIPSSAIWSEDWKGADWNGQLYSLSEDWNLDETLYPDFPGLVSTLATQGIRMLVYRNPFMHRDADVWDEAWAGGHVIKDVQGEPWLTASARFTDTGFLDLSTQASRTWVKSKLAQPLAYGVGGWMADFAEWMPVDGAVLNSGQDPALVHNRYPLWWQQANREVLTEAGVLDDTLVFVRSGHLRSQGLVQVVWAGDQRTDFQADDGMPTVVPLGLGLAATGFFFFAHDIAGYQSSTNPPVTRELFYRWTELGAFTPVMRTHHGTHPLQNWNLSSDAETTAHWKRYAQLHMRMYPYLRRLVHQAVDEGQPLWIPMGLRYPDDDAAWSIKDQFLLGPALLVAPVMTADALSRTVHFPPGRWSPLLEAGVAVSGPASQQVTAALDEIPVFIAAGGIVPMTRDAAETLLAGNATLPGIETTEGDRVVYVGLGADGTFTEESGASYALAGSGSSTQGLTLEPDGSVLVQGNGTVTATGFTFTLSGHPATRVSSVFFR